MAWMSTFHAIIRVVHASLTRKLAFTALVARPVAIVANFFGTLVALMSTNPTEKTRKFAFFRAITTDMTRFVAVEAFWSRVFQKVPMPL